MRSAPPSSKPRSIAFARGLLWIAIYAVPLVVFPNLHEAFRQPKLLAAEWLGLATLVALAPRLTELLSRPKDLLRTPVVLAVLPLLALAALSLVTTVHP